MTWRRCLGGLGALALGALPTDAQSIRITGASWVQGIDLRPLRRDSVRLDATAEAGGVRRAADGTLVSCVEGATWCTYIAAASRETSYPVLHDLSVAGWGLGEGISFHAHGRVRTPMHGGDGAWPRMNDRFDLLDAYLEVDRAAWRARLGRQWSLGGLGAYAYDGGSAVVRRGGADLEVLGGRALVQGLNEPYTTAELGQVTDLPPDQSAWMLGARGRWRTTRHAVTATWLRILASDRSGLYADRAGLDASTRVAGLRVDGALAADLASGVLNEARGRVTRGVGRGVELAVEARRHRPFFELWTIWGAFAPVAFGEARLMATWMSSDAAWSTTLSSGARRYEDPGTGLASAPLRTDGWRLGWDGTWAPSDGWSLVSSYAVDVGVGASQSDGSLGVTRQLGDRATIGFTTSARQTIYEYRLGTGRMLGGFGHASVGLRPDLRLHVEGGAWSHRPSNDAPGPDWSQRRASLRLEWALGADPGMSR